MSGLAKYLLEEGHEVSGSDIFDSKYITALKELGAKVYIGHDKNNLPNDAIVVKSTAIRDNNPEVIKAKELGLKIYHRSDLLKEIAESAQNDGKIFIGYSGTHGKTTTSGLATYVLEKANLKPSYVVGGIIPDINTNSAHQNGKYFTAELDESDGTIVKYSPDILVINNLEEDHIDFYRNGMEDLIKTFNIEISKSKKILVNNDNKGIAALDGEFITFGLNNADYIAKNISYEADCTNFDIYYKNKLLVNLQISLAGVHNVYNALAVAASLNESGVELNNVNVKKAFFDFSGMGRRFQKVCELNGAIIYDDYAHHPTEIKATLDAAALKFGNENIVAVFQPHRYTRLQSLWSEFKNAFKNSERLIVTDIYAASEDSIDGVSSERFSSEIEKSEYMPGSIKEVAKRLLPTIKQGDIVIGLGAGTITTLGKYLQEANGELTCK